MTLTRRALLLIFPVILLSNLFVAFCTYRYQATIVEDVEVARFSSRLNAAASSLLNDLNFVQNISFSMVTSNAFKDFVSNEEARNESWGVDLKLQSAIDFFLKRDKPFVAFTILQSDMSVIYYYESSDDPFAKIGEAQTNSARRLMESGENQSEDFITADDGGLVIYSKLVDPRTFSAPIPTQRSKSLVVQTTVKTADFDRIRREIETQYKTRLRVGRFNQDAVDGRRLQHELTPGMFLNALLPDFYIRHSLSWLRTVTIMSSVALSIVSVGVLILLIMHNMTGPIASLDRQVNAVIGGRQLGISALDVDDEIGRLSRNIKSMHDATLEAFEQIRKISLTDSLTGLSNRSHFQQVGGEWIELSRREERHVALLFIDLDKFKQVNDTLGHASGDDVLRYFSAQTTQLITQFLPLSTKRLFARVAGDEFAVLVQTDAARAEELADLIAEHFRSGLNANDRKFAISATIGVAVAPLHATTLDALSSCADVAMYHAKAAGRARYAVYSPGLTAMSRAS